MGPSPPWDTLAKRCWDFLGAPPVAPGFQNVYTRETERAFAGAHRDVPWGEALQRLLGILGQKLTATDLPMGEAEAWVAVALLVSQMRAGPGEILSMWFEHTEVATVLTAERANLNASLRHGLIRWCTELVLQPLHLVPLMTAPARSPT